MSTAHVIIIIKSEVSTFPIVIIFFRGCVSEMFVTSYSVTYCINSSEPAAVGSSSFHWKKAESIETDMKIILSPNWKTMHILTKTCPIQSSQYRIMPLPINWLYTNFTWLLHKTGTSRRVSLAMLVCLLGRTHALHWKYPEGPSCQKKLILGSFSGHPAPCIPHYYSFPKRIK